MYSLVKNSSILASLMVLELANAALPDTIAVWAGKSDGAHVVYTSELYQETWTTPAIAVQSENRIISPTVGSASFIGTASGTQGLIAVWTERVKGQWLLKVATRDGDNWTTAQQLTTLAGENLAPTIVHDLSGNPWVFWSSNATGDDDIYLTRRINGGWSETEMVNEPNQLPDILPHTSIADNGDVVVEWDTLDTKANLFIKNNRVYSSISVSDSIKDSVEITNVNIPYLANTNGRIGLHFPKNKFSQSAFPSQTPSFKQ